MARVLIGVAVGLLLCYVGSTLMRAGEVSTLWMGHYRGISLPSGASAASERLTLDLAQRGVYQLKSGDATFSGEWHRLGEDIAELWIDSVEKKPHSSGDEFPDAISTIYVGDGRPAIHLLIVREGDYLIEHHDVPDSSAPTMVFVRGK